VFGIIRNDITLIKSFSLLFKILVYTYVLAFCNSLRPSSIF